MNNQEQPRPQVEDVWEHRETKEQYEIIAVGRKYCLYEKGGVEDWGLIDNFTEGFFILIERDGKSYKPKRVFEEGYYPVTVKNWSGEDVAFFNGKHFFITGCEDAFEEHDLIIGEKLEIKRPEMEE